MVEGTLSDRLEYAIRGVPLGLPGRTAVESPHRDIRKGQFLGIAIDDLRFAAQARNRRVAIEPDVFEFEFRHVVVSSRS